MRRRILSPAQIVLLLALASLVTVVILQGRRGRKIETAAPPASDLLELAKIEEIQFKRQGVSVRVVREADGFWIVEPYRDRADERFLAQSIKVASTISPMRSLPDTAGALFGLAPPEASWSCRWPGGGLAISLGDSLPTGGGRFARVSGVPNVLVLDSFLSRRYLSPPVAEIHEPSAAMLDVGPVDSIRIRTREEDLAAVRHRADYWEFLRPTRLEGSAPQLGRAVEALRSDGLTEFLGPTDRQDLRSLGLEPPRAVWTLIQGTRRQAVRIGHPTADETSVYVIPAGREVVALISSENFRQWVDGLSRLRETLLLATPAEAVVSVDADGPAGVRRYSRSTGGVWREIASGESLAVRSDAFARLILNTCQLRAVGFDDGPAARDFVLEIRLRLHRESGETDTLRMEEPAEGISRAWTRSQPGISRISADPYRAWKVWMERPQRP